MDIAIRVSQLSHANRKKVGAVLVKNGNMIGYSWNGTPPGFPNECEDENNNTVPWLVHAEANIISKLAKSNETTEGSELYITLSPCYNCSLLIVQAGIKTVYYIEEYRIADPIKLLKKAGIKVIKYERKNN